jgi:hypothetical protein
METSMDRLRRSLDDWGEPIEPEEPQEAEVIPFATEIAQALLGFRHAYLDFSTCAIYLSTDRYGLPADYHSLEGLPDEVVQRRWITGTVSSVKPTLIAGFERNGLFYTRKSAARAAAEWLVKD